MASAAAQGSKKKKDLEAGRKKLEEFRKEKAARRAKKSVSDGPVHTSDTGPHENQLSDSEHVRGVDSDVVGASDAIEAVTSELSRVEDTKVVEPEKFDRGSSNFPSGASANFPASGASFPPDLPRKEIKGDDASQYTKQLNAEYDPPPKREIDGVLESTSTGVAMNLPSRSLDNTSWLSRNNGSYENFPSDSDNRGKGFSASNLDSSHSSLTNGFAEKSGMGFPRETSGYSDRMVGNTSSSHEASLHSTRSSTNYIPAGVGKVDGLDNYGSLFSDEKENKLSSSAQMPSANNLSPWPLDSKYSGSSLSNYGQLSSSSPGNYARRSRPSFLDSINVSKGSSASPPVTGSLKVDSLGSKIHPEDTLGSHDQNFTYSSLASGNGVDMFKQVLDRNFGSKPNEDFMALEQHIEDLTQEKFSLQRALDASRALAESLAAENSALTDNYNQQGGVVNQLRSDLEMLQQEIRANLMELESVKAEYSNAHLECNAADERAKLLASEVIGLEEKALRLRSNELKLERRLEESQAEISNFKKRISSMEKDRQDLQSTIEALQEEKKLLHSRIRKASANEKLVEVSKSSTIKKDISTSTEDLGENNNGEADSGSSNMLGNDGSSLLLLHDDREFSLQDRSLTIPPDQLRMIENINTLITELTLEKEELVQALSAESSQASKLKELNKELSRKLEVQTQKLELLTAQSMVSDGVQVRQPDSHTMNDNTPYADEGDEVVERVLGWIMKLFPGGPSRRRTSKLL